MNGGNSFFVGWRPVIMRRCFKYLVACTVLYNISVELNISEVRQRLLTLVDDIPAEGVTITRHGEPVARLLPVGSPSQGRRVSFPLIRSKGNPGPLAPNNENPHDLILP